MALSPIYASDETQFLQELETELTVLENSLIKLSSLSQEQKSEVKRLSEMSVSLETKLIESQKELTELRTKSETLQSQWSDLKTSLDESVKELNSLTVKNKLLIGAIGVSLTLGLVAVIIVAVK